jgi:hypothetical protein
MRVTTIVAIAAFAGAGTIATLDAAGARARSNAAMTRAATSFLQSLTPEQRAKATFAFDHAERLNWHFIPRTRLGLPFKEMTEAQRGAARVLLQTGVSQRGVLKVNSIIDLENVLREMGGNPVQRDPENYFFSVFGTPSESQPWGWRFEGHHLSLNFTVSGSSIVATAPSFMGANPANVQSGSRQGLRALAAEEDLAREFMASLDSAQRSRATLAGRVPSDILTMNRNDITPFDTTGIPVSALRPEQSARLLKIIDEYLSRMHDDIAAARRSRLQQTDFSRVSFAWSGTLDRGAPHYYRIQGPSFLIEYDNTQNNANHIHSVWRDFNGDFGRDLLREHYQAVPHIR